MIAGESIARMTPPTSAPAQFALVWIGVATVFLLMVGLLAGLVRDDVPGTLGPVAAVGLFASSVVVAGMLAVGHGSSRRR